MKDYLTMQCRPVTDESEGLTMDEVTDLLARFKDWRMVRVPEGPRLRREFTFIDFQEGAAFAQALADRADNQGYHPQIVLDYGEVRVDWWESDLGALHENDFIMAAITDDLYDRWDLIGGNQDRLETALDETFPASDPVQH